MKNVSSLEILLVSFFIMFGCKTFLEHNLDRRWAIIFNLEPHWGFQNDLQGALKLTLVNFNN